MSATEYIGFLLALMAAGIPSKVTPEPSTSNGGCRCSDPTCHGVAS